MKYFCSFSNGMGKLKSMTANNVIPNIVDILTCMFIMLADYYNCMNDFL